MSYDSDIGDLSDWLDEAIDEIGWDMPAGAEGATHGRAQTLGEASVETVIDGIQARALVRRGADALGPDEEDWPPNTPSYRRDKERRYGEHNPNFRTNQMLSRESLRGKPQVGHEAVEWKYGTDLAAENARTKHDRSITDVEKARLAESGQSKHQIRRPFFAVSEQDADEVLIVVEDAIAQHFVRKAQTT